MAADHSHFTKRTLEIGPMTFRRSLLLFISSILVVCFCFSFTPAYAQWTPLNPVRRVQQQADGVVLSMGTGTLKIQVCSDSIIRVLYSPTTTFPKRTDYVV